MALNPGREAFITCALTGAGDTTGRSDRVPVTPAEIAEAGIEAARAGAAVIHVHVRDPETGRPARDPALYREVVERVRESDTDVVLNLTAGMGGDLTLGPSDRPLPPSQAGTDMAGAGERLAHVAELLPEICTLDCGTMNFGEGDYIMTNTPAMLADMAKRVQALGVRPEIEVFDTGHLVFAKWLAGQGLIDEPVMVQFCMGVPWGAPDDIGTLMSLVNNLPAGWTFLGLFARPQPASLRRARRACRRQCQGRAGGQYLARPGCARDQCRPCPPGGRHRGEYGRAGAGSGSRARKAGVAQALSKAQPGARDGRRHRTRGLRRRRRHRQRLGGPLRAERHRRFALRPGPGGRPARRGGSGQCRARLQPPVRGHAPGTRPAADSPERRRSR